MVNQRRQYPLAAAEERAARAEELLREEHRVRVDTEAKRAFEARRAQKLELALHHSERTVVSVTSRDAHYQAELRKREREYERSAQNEFGPPLHLRVNLP